MKTIKPQRLGVLTRTFEHEGKCLFVTTILVGFRFDEPDVPIHEAALWQSVAARLGTEQALDEAMVKTRAEVLVTGRAYQPGGSPGIGCAVRLEAGPIDKQLYVVGDRHWGATGPSAPQPFVEMPVTWARAYGGESSAENPFGLGADTVIDKSGNKRAPLPNIEDPKALIKSRSDKPKPVGFGPIDTRSAVRRRRGGTYDKSWLEKRFPAYPADFDWEFFNVAPSDQRLDEFFEGGETFSIENMHPEKPKLEGRAPRLVGRAFITRLTETGEKEFRDIPTKLDTLHLFPDLELGVASYRGVTEVTEDDAADVIELVIAAENIGEAKPLSHYREALDNRLDKEKGALFLLRDRDLLPALPEHHEPMGYEEISDLPKLLALDSLLAKNLRKKAEAELETLREICRQHGVDPDEHLPNELPPAVDEEPNLDELDTYVDQKRAEAEAARAEAEKQQRAMLEEARRMCAEHDVDFDALIEAGRKDGAGPPKFRAEYELEKLRDMRQLGENAGVPLPVVEARLADPLLLEKLQAAERQLMEAYRQNAHEFPAASRLSEEGSVGLAVRLRAAVDSEDSLVACDYTGARLAGIALREKNLRGIFLEAADLSGADLSGCDLSDAVLVRADLTGANLAGAKLVGANLGEAKLENANLAGCDMSRTNLTRASLKNTRLDGALLEQAFFFEARIEGGSFAGVRAKQLFFHELDMSGVDLSGAELPECVFVESQLTDARFRGALLEGACFVTVNADRSDFEDARCDNLRVVHGCSMDGVSFRNARLARANLRDTPMRGANLQNATAPGLDLSGCDLTDGALEQLNAPNAMLVRTNLTRAKLMRADLMQGILQKANIEGADFSGANLFRGDFAKIRGNVDTRFEGANMKYIRFVDREQHG